MRYTKSDSPLARFHQARWPASADRGERALRRGVNLVDKRQPPGLEPQAAPIFKRLRSDPFLWGKLAALWHRERVRDEYVASGYTRHQARQKSNDEALEVARSHGWKGDVNELKSELAELLANQLPGLRRRQGGDGPAYWEDEVHDQMMHALGSPPAALKDRLLAFLRHDVAVRGRYTGPMGLYRLGYIIGYIPPIEHLDRRNAFISGLSEVGQDRRLCDRDLFKMIMRFSRLYTLKPFETRMGFPMPPAEKPAKRPARRFFGILRADDK